MGWRDLLGCPTEGMSIRIINKKLKKGAVQIVRGFIRTQLDFEIILVEEDRSRPGMDAGPEFAARPILVRRPFRARSHVVPFPVAALRSATG